MSGLVAKILSGGQTGVDRAALDVALALGIPCGGWCPRDRRAEDGVLPDRYPLTETPSDDYAQRTEWNVRDADGTLVLARGEVTGGTGYTIEQARRRGKPCLVVDLAQAPAAEPVRAWVERHQVRVVNVAGSRESQRPGIYAEAVTFLRTLLAGVLMMMVVGHAAGEEGTMPDQIVKSDAEWRQQLTPEQYRILRAHGTERAFTGAYWKSHDPGTYRCAACTLPLFSSQQKFDSGTGWPSFWAPIAPTAVGTQEDRSFFVRRTEVHCRRCGGHLGHIFEDGPAPTGLRYCINSGALTFVPVEE